MIPEVSFTAAQLLLPAAVARYSLLLSSVSIHKSPADIAVGAEVPTKVCVLVSTVPDKEVMELFVATISSSLSSTLEVKRPTAVFIAPTPVVPLLTVVSKLVILVEAEPFKPTAVDKLDTAVAFAATLVSTTATQALPLHLYCLLLS